MSEGCLLFTLKMTWQSNLYWTEILPAGNFSQMWKLVKSINRQFLGLEAKKKIVQKCEKIKQSYFSQFWPLGRDIDDLCFLRVITFGWNYLKVKSLFPNDFTVIFKVNNQHPSEILNFGGVTKYNHKKHRLRDSFKFYCPTLAEVYPQQNLIQVLSASKVV